MYYHEIEQKDIINSRISTPLGIITLLCGGAVYLFQDLNSFNENSFKNTFYILLAIYIFSLLLCILFSIKSYYGYEYKYVPIPEKIQEHTDKLNTHYSKHYITYFSIHGPCKEKYIKEQLEIYLSKKFKEATDWNTKMNEKKFKYLRFVGLSIILSIVVGLLCFIFYCISKDIANDGNTIKILINNIKLEWR